MQLPDMTGLEVLQALKRNEGTRGLRVIALSANAMERDVSETLSAGARDYWTKPIDVPRFLQGLRQVLEKGSAELHGCVFQAIVDGVSG
jgi:CheY-like chemotaxis protein